MPGGDMSVKAMSWAFGIDVDPVKKVILLSLADCADDNGRCFPGYALLAEKSSVCTKTVKRNVKKLEDLGLVIKVNRRKGKRYTSNEYHLQLDVTEPKTPINDGDTESQSDETPEKNLPRDNESIGRDSKSTEVGTPDVPVIVTDPSQNPDSDADEAHEPQTLDGDFLVCEPEIDLHTNEPEHGIFGSHLLSEQHPYLYWFLLEMEKRAARNSDALGDFAERLVMFGLAGAYCQASLANFLKARKVRMDEYLMSQDREDAITAWAEHAAELIDEADEALADFREYLANQVA